MNIAGIFSKENNFVLQAAETVRVVAMGIRAGIRFHTCTGLRIPYGKHFVGCC